MKSFKYLALFFILLACFGLEDTLATNSNVAKSKTTNQIERSCSIQDSSKTGKKRLDDKATEETKKTIKLGNRFLFGVATSYADSVTYITNIFEVNGMEGRVQEKTPIGIDLYTQSLKDYLKEKGKIGYLCTTYVCKSKKEAEQKILKVRGNIQHNKLTTLQPIGDFSYKYISTEHIFSNESKESEKEVSDEDF